MGLLPFLPPADAPERKKERAPRHSGSNGGGKEQEMRLAWLWWHLVWRRSSFLCVWSEDMEVARYYIICGPPSNISSSLILFFPATLHRRRQISTLRMHLRSSPSALQCLEVLHRTLALRVAQSHPSPSALSVATLDPLPPHESFSLRSAPPPITSSSALRVPRSSSCYAPFFFLPSFSTRACPKWDE